MMDSILAAMPYSMGAVFGESRAPVPAEERIWGGNAFYRIYETGDGARGAGRGRDEVRAQPAGRARTRDGADRRARPRAPRRAALLRAGAGKTAPALVLRLLAEQGKRVQNVLDMTSGMDVIETQAGREDPRSTITRFNLSITGEPAADGRAENQLDVIRSARRTRPAGEAFEYSSVNTAVLGLVAEAVEGKLWGDIFQSLVWSRMGAEGDATLGISPDGVPQVQGFLSSRLRDVGRYGMLYTPSWNMAAREQIVQDAYVRAIQTGGRKAIFAEGEIGKRQISSNFPASPPSSNSWQWDAVFDDGDFYKGGVYGQGLYVSPAKDLVVAWFSTVSATHLTKYARAIALATSAAQDRAP